jgi:hypothetical protein
LQRCKPTKSDLFCEIKYLLKQIYGAITKKQKQFILYFDLAVWNKIAMLRAKKTTNLQLHYKTKLRQCVKQNLLAKLRICLAYFAW